MKKVKTLHKVLIITAVVLIAITLAMFIWMSIYYPADSVAVALLTSENVVSKENMLVVSPKEQSSTAIIFYPGAKVEYSAYLPLMHSIAESCGVTCFLLEMPFNMAFFDVNGATQVIADHPEIDNWYLAGHSLGGAMASSYASNNQEVVKGLIVLGSYVYGDYPTAKSLTVYGTFNDNLEPKITYTDNIVIIEGGNHAQFGNYGKQKGDPDATITNVEQQQQTVTAIKEFLLTNGK